MLWLGIVVKISFVGRGKGICLVCGYKRLAVTKERKRETSLDDVLEEYCNNECREDQ